MHAQLAILITGGTFDKEYNELTGALFFKRTHIKEMLALGRCRLPIRVQRIMMKDSLFMTPSDRRRILNACHNSRESRLVITHGTDTMETTAQFLVPRLSGKTVILTGAMIPYRFGSSDGMFNLASALAFAQTLPVGVYIAMNGRFFPGDCVTKNRQRGHFQKSSRLSAPHAQESLLHP